MSQFFKTREETENWLDEMEVKNYTINDDLSVDVDGVVNLYSRYLSYIPVQFGKVNRFFDCSYNQLTSLKGCPSVVNVGFNCSHNKLTSLGGAPMVHGRDFSCSHNYLVSLKTKHSIMIKNFYCHYNYLTTTDSKNEPYELCEANPGYQETDITKIAQNFLDKLENHDIPNSDKIRILKKLNVMKQEVYRELVKLVDINDWINRLKNAEKHTDIIDL